MKHQPKRKLAVRIRRLKAPLAAKKPTAKSRQKVAIKRGIKNSRPVHKRILLSPLSVLILLSATVFLASWTYKAIADTVISAEIFAPALLQSATITSPIDGTVYTLNAPITISGTCPNNSYVNTSINGHFTGTVLCNSTDDFTLQTYLFGGENVITAQDYNVTDQKGPTSQSVSVNLALPSLPSQSGSTSSGSNKSSSASSGTTLPSPTAPQLLINSAFSWQTFSTNSGYSWQLTIGGGTPPYVVNVNWGDGKSTLYTFTTDPSFTITHKYLKPKYYAISVIATDANNNHQLIQLAALITPPRSTGNFFTSTPTKTVPKTSGLAGFFDSSKNWLWVAWPSLIVVGLMTFTFWLGELQQKSLAWAKSRHRN